ncbi:HK97 gp10 family phage protein [Iodobacter sp. CM08]|uniref:HK97-gp10 family putative phage morphogenesis protein n=1 Tax=Iodobacter sp. CM08 TaxID=3085902 RepID=UPI002981CCBA|nr:HK97-gp10 family putative phage morphogenesis protein [Iodobacter sp. CM08]MDW5417742.1 HK97 gp10 family phage protein [Iodobacter sp. CM08]
MSADISTLGNAEIKQKLLDLADIGKRRHVLAALYQGAMVYRKEIEAKAPYKTGFLKKSIAAWRVPKRYQLDQDIPEARAGIVRNVFRLNRPRRVPLTGRRAKSKKGGHFAVVNAFYARYVEFGTSKMSAKPFIRPAYASAQSAAFAAVSNNISKAMARIAR